MIWNLSQFRILFLGDTSFGENYQAQYKQNGRENILEEMGYDYPLQNLKTMLLQSDTAIANLETPITFMESSIPNVRKRYVHWTDGQTVPEYLKK